MRKYSAYEVNRLQKYGLDPFGIKDEAKPVEYLTGFAEFFGREFKVNENVLISRIETEKLVDLALNLIPNTQNLDPVKIAEIGTGSGAIGITLALELEKKGVPYEIFMSDISDKALKIAKENLARLLDSKKESRFTSRNNNNQSFQKIKIIKSDLLNDYPKSTHAKFDLIIANLPYIPTNRISHLNSSVKDFEPQIALDGGEDGLKYIKKLLKQSPRFLKPKGLILLEVDDTHTQDIANKIAEQTNLKIKVKKDLNQKTRFWIINPK